LSVIHELSQSIPEWNRGSLHADCENCFGLCCVSLPFTASIDFAIDKDAGQPCSNLQSNFRCGIHQSLRERGFKGCTVYDCFGAGQQVSQVTYNGQDWRQVPDTAEQMFEVFRVMRQIHELLWYLNEALALETTQSIHDELRFMLEETERFTRLSPDSLVELHVSAHRLEINKLLLKASVLVREEALRTNKKNNTRGRKKTFERGADLMGAKLRGADLIGANLRGSYLIAADLRDADLRAADLIGADFRDADLSGTNLSKSLFLTQFQLNAAKGNADTKIPPTLTRPTHWLA